MDAPQDSPIKPTETVPEAIQPIKTIEDINRPVKQLKKTLMAIQMVNAGIPEREALMMVNNKRSISGQAIAELKHKVIQHGLTEPSMVKAMSSQVKRILKGRAREEAHQKVTAAGQVVEYTDNVYPTDSNILAACAMVADRVEPIVHQVASLNLNMDLSPVDLSRWDNQMGKIDNPVDKSSCQQADRAIDV